MQWLSVSVIQKFPKFWEFISLSTGSLYKASYVDFSSLKISDLSIVFLNSFKGTHNKGSRHKENWDDCHQAKTLASNV